MSILIMSYFLNFAFLVGIYGSKVHELLRVDKGTCLSFIDLWDLQGYKTGATGSRIHRNSYIDIPFSPDCPKNLYIGFRNADKVYFYFGAKQPFSSNSIVAAMASATKAIHLTEIISSFSVKITPEEEVILKIFKQNESMQNLYLAVYLPKHRTGYPRYYIPKTTYQPSYGKIPGDENLFNETDYMRIIGYYDYGCNLTDTGQLKTENEIKAIIKTNNKMKTCNIVSKHGFQYKRSEQGHATVANATTLWTITVKNLVMCSLKCSEKKCNCESFFFTPDTGKCIGLNHVEDALDKPPEAVHYIPDTGNCHN